MKKTFYYNFIPSKAEEMLCELTKTPYEVTRVLVEINDVYPPPVIDYGNPWIIKKKLTPYEVTLGMLVVSFVDTFEHIFRYWTLSMANSVVLGGKVPVVLWDVTDEIDQKKYHSDGFYFEMLPNDYYVLACMDLFKDRKLDVADEIGLFFDPRNSCFQFKLLNKAIIPID